MWKRARFLLGEADFRGLGRESDEGGRLGAQKGRGGGGAGEKGIKEEESLALKSNIVQEVKGNRWPWRMWPSKPGRKGRC